MTPRRPDTAARRWTRALLPGLAAVLSALVFAPGGDARAAGCVHDGLRRAWQVEGVAHFDHLMANGALVVPDGVTPVEPVAAEASKPKPLCDGPSCSSNRGLPSAPPVVSIAAQPSVWAILLASLDPASCGSSHLVVADDGPRPDPAASAVFHPPRLGSA